ncbi:unnamed protein product, partial [Heterosigma akashiwo]
MFQQPPLAWIIDRLHYGGMGRKWRMPGGGQTSAKKACRVEIRPFLNHPK